MPRRQRTSPAITAAESRATGLRAIDPNLDLGNGHTLAVFEEQIEQAKKTLSDYNRLLAQCNSEQLKLEGIEEKVSHLTSTYLRAVAVKYGPDSIAYQKAGGRRRSDRRRPTRKTPQKTAQTGTPQAPPNTEQAS